MIDKFNNLDSDTFQASYEKFNKPVLIKGIDHTLSKKWQIDYLKNLIGEREINIQLMRKDKDGFLKTSFKKMSFNEAIGIFNNHKKLKNTKHYISGDSVKANLKELINDIPVPKFLSNQKIYDYGFWYGEVGNITPLHFDCYEIFLHQIKGCKIIRLYAPDQSKNLYLPFNNKRLDWFRVSKVYRSLDNNTLNVFPNLKNAKYIELELHPGDFVYIPCGWWHYVFSPEEAISLNYLWQPKALNCQLGTMLEKTANILLRRNNFQEVFEIFDFTPMKNPIEIAHYYNDYGGKDRWLSLFFISFAVQQSILQLYKKHQLTLSNPNKNLITLYRGLYSINQNLLTKEHLIKKLQKLTDNWKEKTDRKDIHNLINNINNIKINN